MGAILRVWYLDEQQESQKQTSGLMEQKREETEEEITVENYDEANSILYLRNTGLTTVDTNAIEIYEEGTALNATIAPSFLPKGEVASANISLTLGKTYKITTETGYTAIFEYNVGNLLLYPEKETIPNDGNSTTITAVVKDNFGNREAGMPIQFITTLGTFSESTNATYTTTTDTSGEATATLVSGAGTGKAEITALSGGYTSMTSVIIENG